MAIFSKEKVSKYIASKYNEMYNSEITPIKLQKALYLLYAHYGGEVISSSGEFLSEKYLFDACFEAWDYGPVDKDIYHMYKDNSKKFIVNMGDLKKEMTSVEAGGESIEYVDYLLPMIFEINDFKLVELTHLDKSWQSVFKERNGYFIQAKNMKNDSIINEYAERKIAKKKTK